MGRVQMILFAAEDNLNLRILHMFEGICSLASGQTKTRY